MSLIVLNLAHGYLVRHIGQISPREKWTVDFGLETSLTTFATSVT
jgi:hypothetical protein